TRGTMLALGVAGFVALVHLATRSKGKSRTWSAWLLVALVAIGELFFTFRTEIAKVPFTPIARIASVSLTEGDVASRLFIWKNMMGEIQKSPWVGVGGEHVDILFNRFYDPTQIYEQWFDRSHNAFVDYTVQYGIGGLLLYLALIASFITAAGRYARHADRPTAGLFVLLAITYAVQNVFVFDTVSSFWLLLALLAAFTALSLKESPRETLVLPTWARPVSWIVALVLVASIMQVSVRPLVAAYDLAHAYTYQLVDVSKEVEYLSRGFALETYGDVEYGYTAYDMYAHTQASQLSGQKRVDAYEIARSILTTNFNRYPYDARTALYLAHVLSLVPPGVEANQELLGSALERAIRLSPKRAQPWYILTNLSISGANTYPPLSKERITGYTAARDLLSRYITFVPTLAEPYFVLAQLLYASGDKDGARAAAEKGKKSYVGTLESATRAAGYYETVVDLPNAAFFLSEVVRIDPTNTAALGDLEKIRAYERSQK
ncbi:MAG: O-antigen ligase family protein, partial [Minisyncoccia bacterium]